jgi:uncharacterized protein GlcG (DUF336 family)
LTARSLGFQVAPARGRVSPLLFPLLLIPLLGSTGCEDQKDDDRGCSAADCDLSVALTAAEVSEIIGRAVVEAQSLGIVDATIAVTDRENNVLAVFQMFDPVSPPADPTDLTYRETTIESNRAPPVVGGLEGITVPNALAAITKAGTASVMSSTGAAFTTRTANQITQENFNPGEPDRAGGPLFGIQFSQLPCSDFNRREGERGLKRLPLGFTTDPGGVPLSLGNVAVGGVGVEFNGSVTNDRDVFDVDTQLEERIAVAAAGRFSAPEERLANHVSLDGRSLRFVDDDNARTSAGATLPLPGPAVGALVPVPGFFSDASSVRAGVPFGVPALGSGFLPVNINFAFDASGQFEVLTLDGVTNLFGPRDSGLPAVPVGLSTVEVMTILQQTLLLTGEVRAQVRRPLGESARISVTVVDTAGTILGFARNRDALLFGPDVSVQKARTAAFLSTANAAADLQDPAADPIGNAAAPGPGIAALNVNGIANYVTDTQRFLDDPTDAFIGTRGYSTTSIGAISRPFFPNGINGNSPGSLSRPFPIWSQFMTGLQLEVSLPGIAVALCPLVRDLRVVLFELGQIADPDDPTGCPFPAPVGLPPFPVPASPLSCTDLVDPATLPVGDPCLRAGAPPLCELSNGPQIFSGGVPIYRGSALVGGIGISGDGAEQDDLLAFLGLTRASQTLGGVIGNAPRPIRSDEVTVGGKNLRFVRCPVDPFLGRNEQNACEDN